MRAISSMRSSSMRTSFVDLKLGTFTVKLSSFSSVISKCKLANISLMRLLLMLTPILVRAFSVFNLMITGL